MKYSSEIAEQIRQIDHLVLLQKEYDLYEHKKRHVRKMIALEWKNSKNSKILSKEFREIARHMKFLEYQMLPIQELVDCPRLLIKRYMELYQVSIPSVSRTLRISATSIHNYLERASQTPETRSFIFWAIRNFRLDANRYLKLLEETSQVS